MFDVPVARDRDSAFLTWPDVFKRQNAGRFRFQAFQFVLHLVLIINLIMVIVKRVFNGSFPGAFVKF